MPKRKHQKMTQKTSKVTQRKKQQNQLTPNNKKSAKFAFRDRFYLETPDLRARRKEIIDFHEERFKQIRDKECFKRDILAEFEELEEGLRNEISLKTQETYPLTLYLDDFDLDQSLRLPFYLILPVEKAEVEMFKGIINKFSVKSMSYYYQLKAGFWEKSLSYTQKENLQPPFLMFDTETLLEIRNGMIDQTLGIEWTKEEKQFVFNWTIRAAYYQNLQTKLRDIINEDKNDMTVIEDWVVPCLQKQQMRVAEMADVELQTKPGPDDDLTQQYQ